MSLRNLTEVFCIMRNNASKNRVLYAEHKRFSGDRTEDAEMLIQRSVCEVEDGIELHDEYGTQPIWIDKLEEAQYTISKIRPKLDELGSLQTRDLLRPTFDETTEDHLEMEHLSHEISKLISSAHRHIQCIRSSLGVGTKTEQRLTMNVVAYLLLSLQEITVKFRNNQNAYVKQLNMREERSQKYFDNITKTNDYEERENYVDTFDNFLQLQGTTRIKSYNNAASCNADDDYNENSQRDLDGDFQRPPSNRLTQQQLLLFEEENTRLALSRDEEVTKIVKSIYDLNDIFKDLSQIVQEQGTILDRIDYAIEQSQSSVTEGLQQLHRAEMYQRKNRKMCIIIVLAVVTLFLLVLLIFTKM